MLVNNPGEYPQPDKDNKSEEVLLLKPDRYDNVLPGAPSPQMAVRFSPLPGHHHHLKWWLTKYCEDHEDIFHMHAVMGNDKCTEM